MLIVIGTTMEYNEHIGNMQIYTCMCVCVCGCVCLEEARECMIKERKMNKYQETVIEKTKN